MAACAATSFQCSDDDGENTDPKDDNKSITAFTFAGLDPAVIAAIDETAKTITATVPAGTNVTSLIPTVTVAETATVTPASGAAQDFTNPITYTVTAEDDSQQTYTVTVTVAPPPEQDCRPSELAGAGGLLYITYNTDGTVNTVTSPPTGGTPGFMLGYIYADGKRTRVNMYNDDVELIGYNTIEYPDPTITLEFVYEIDGEIERQPRYFIHFLEDDRIIATVDYINDGTEVYDSIRYTYTNDNITRVDGYGATTDEVQYYYTYTYDDKINPHALIDVSGYHGMGFLPISRSKNNIKSIEYHSDGSDYTSQYSYTYNGNNLPLTFTEDAQTLNFEYVCD